MSFSQTLGMPPIMSLHRYWIYSNRMRQYFDAALEKEPQDFTNLVRSNNAENFPRVDKTVDKASASCDLLTQTVSVRGRK